MTTERRNHYRTLQVQPGAHPEVIAASYRRLMGRLRRPPAAVQDRDSIDRVEEAYAVLGNKTRRLHYDTQRMALRRPEKTSDDAVSIRTPAPIGNCPFCAEKAPRIIAATTRCARCEAPLAPVLACGPLAMPYHGRAHERRPQSDFAHLRLERTGPLYNVKLRDVSSGGLSFFSGKEPSDGSLLHVMTPKVDTVASVVRVRPHGRVSIVHARMLTACYLNRAGVFVSAVI